MQHQTLRYGYMNSKPTKLQILQGWLTFAIPCAILARIIRFIKDEKGTEYEVKLMKYYYKKEKQILGE